MNQDRSKEQARLRELNRLFLEQIENGKSWDDVHYILEEMKEVTKRLDPLSAQVVQFDDYPLNKTAESNI